MIPVTQGGGPTMKRTPGAGGLVALLLLFAVAVTPGAASPACPGPAICGKSCSLDAFGTPIYCSDGQCVCPPGYDTEAGPPLLCQPHQPEFMGSSSDVAACPGSCTSTPWGIAGGISNAFDIVAVHGTSPGGEAFMPVWGFQANNCGVHGVVKTDADGNPIRSWAGCTPN